MRVPCRSDLSSAAALLTILLTANSLVAQSPQPQASYPLLVDLLDQTQNYGPMMLQGTPPPAPPNNGVCVNGVYANNTGGQDILTPDITTLDTNDFQVDVEFIINALPTSDDPVLMASKWYRWLGIYIQPSGMVGIKHNNSNLLWSSTVLAQGVWYAASLQYENGFVALSINGSLVLQAAIGPLNTGNYRDFTTNDWSNGGNFNGCIRNLVIANDTTIQAAQWTTYGAGCVGGGPPGFYEQFNASSNFDIANTGVTLLSAPPTYLLTQGAAPIVPPTTGAQTLGDDQTVQVPLPWTFLYQGGGSTNDLWVCSNGWISLESTTSTDYSESIAEFLSGPARVCAMWDDLNPNSGGTVHWEQDPTDPTLFHVTFLGVPEYSATGANDFQYTFHQNGTIELKWGACTVADCIVGFALGNGQGDPGATDISAVVAEVLGDGTLGLALDSLAGARPVLGTTFDMEVSEMPTTAIFGAMIYSFTKHDPGISLSSIGMDTCFQYVAMDASRVFIPAGPTHVASVVLPNAPSVAGMHMYAQAAILGSTLTTLGALSSNGGDMKLDVN